VAGKKLSTGRGLTKIFFDLYLKRMMGKEILKEHKLHLIWDAMTTAREGNSLSFEEIAKEVVSALGDDAKKLAIEISKIFYKKEMEKRNKKMSEAEKKFEEDFKDWRELAVKYAHMEKTINELLDHFKLLNS